MELKGRLKLWGIVSLIVFIIFVYYKTPIKYAFYIALFFFGFSLYFTDPGVIKANKEKNRRRREREVNDREVMHDEYIRETARQRAKKDSRRREPPLRTGFESGDIIRGFKKPRRKKRKR